jgi:hypothetical protein
MQTYLFFIHGALYLAYIVILFTQIPMLAALMIQLKMGILCFTCHAYMAIYLACRFTFFTFYIVLHLFRRFPLLIVVVSNYGHLASYCCNVEQAWSAKMKKVQFLSMTLVLEVCIFHLRRAYFPNYALLYVYFITGFTEIVQCILNFAANTEGCAMRMLNTVDAEGDTVNSQLFV